MNIFAHIERLDDFQFNVVKYYSVYLEVDGEVNDVNEFFDFLNRMEDIEEIEDDLSNLFGLKKLAKILVQIKIDFSEMNLLQPMYKLCPLLQNKCR